MRENEPLVSICIPTFNRAEKLERAIKSILKGSYQNIKIIISDNASSDKTYDICSHFSKSNGNISYYRHHKNLGPQHNFEFARHKAVGKYFMWHSDDDYLDVDYIKECIFELERDQELIVVAGLGVYYNDKGVLDHTGNAINCRSNSPFLRILKYILMVGENSIFYGVYRRRETLDLKIENTLGSDWAWMTGVISRGKSKIIPTISMNREFETSTSSSVKKIVSTLRLPEWNNWFPWTAVTINIAKYIRANVEEYKGDLSFKKKCEYYFIVLILIFKSSTMNLSVYASKIPIFKKIYKKIFKRAKQK